VWWLFIDAPTPWFVAFVGMWAVFVAALGLNGHWDVALLSAVVPATLVLVRMVRVQRRRR
jgi:hypothetical protein